MARTGGAETHVSTERVNRAAKPWPPLDRAVTMDLSEPCACGDRHGHELAVDVQGRSLVMTEPVMERVRRAERLGDAFTTAAHVTDSAEYMIAGLKDSSGLDLLPSQAARFVITWECIIEGLRTRTPSTGDAEFVSTMLSAFVPDFHDSDATRRRIWAAAAQDQEQGFPSFATMAHEMMLMPQVRAALNGYSLDGEFDSLIADFRAPWPDTELNTPLSQAGAGAGSRPTADQIDSQWKFISSSLPAGAEPQSRFSAVDAEHMYFFISTRSHLVASVIGEPNTVNIPIRSIRAITYVNVRESRELSEFEIYTGPKSVFRVFRVGPREEVLKFLASLPTAVTQAVIDEESSNDTQRYQRPRVTGDARALERAYEHLSGDQMEWMGALVGLFGTPLLCGRAFGERSRLVKVVIFPDHLLLFQAGGATDIYDLRTQTLEIRNPDNFWVEVHIGGQPYVRLGKKEPVEVFQSMQSYVSDVQRAAMAAALMPVTQIGLPNRSKTPAKAFKGDAGPMTARVGDGLIAAGKLILAAVIVFWLLKLLL